MLCIFKMFCSDVYCDNMPMLNPEVSNPARQKQSGQQVFSTTRVKNVQRYLVKLGYLKQGSYKPGVMDIKTRVAIIKFQKDHPEARKGGYFTGDQRGLFRNISQLIRHEVMKRVAIPKKSKQEVKEALAWTKSLSSIIPKKKIAKNKTKQKDEPKIRTMSFNRGGVINIGPKSADRKKMENWFNKTFNPSGLLSDIINPNKTKMMAKKQSKSKKSQVAEKRYVRKNSILKFLPKNSKKLVKNTTSNSRLNEAFGSTNKQQKVAKKQQPKAKNTKVAVNKNKSKISRTGKRKQVFNYKFLAGITEQNTRVYYSNGLLHYNIEYSNGDVSGAIEMDESTYNKFARNTSNDAELIKRLMEYYPKIYRHIFSQYNNLNK